MRTYDEDDNDVYVVYFGNSINGVIDLHSTHLALARRHLPVPIMALLLATVAISFGMIGFGRP